jgi:hypothetical protein
MGSNHLTVHTTTLLSVSLYCLFTCALCDHGMVADPRYGTWVLLPPPPLLRHPGSSSADVVEIPGMGHGFSSSSDAALIMGMDPGPSSFSDAALIPGLYSGSSSVVLLSRPVMLCCGCCVLDPLRWGRGVGSRVHRTGNK